MLKKWLENDPKITWICVGVSVPALILSLTGILKGILPIDIAWIAILLCGTPILIGAFRGVIFEHDIKADLLVSLALIASVCTGEFFAAGEVALIMQIGSLLEDFTSGKARENIEKLIDRTPRTARVIRRAADEAGSAEKAGNGEQESVIPAEQVCVGDLLSVIPGEMVPVDGTIISGNTSIDQSVMTGESLPVDKTVGDEVMSGTINQFGAFIMRCDRVSTDSSLQRMVLLAKEAEEKKAPIVNAADKWATYLVLIALSCSVITGLVTRDFMRAVTVLVVFCPCAFILATPTAVLAGIGNAAKYGMIIKSGEALERIAGIRLVAFDKTGTLTYGRPEVLKVTSLDSRYTEDEILRFAALTELRSEHPLGKAILRKYRSGKEFQENVDNSLKAIDRSEAAADFQMVSGLGVSATVDGHRIMVGKKCAEESSEPSEEDALGATLAYVHVDGKAVGSIALADVMREDAKKVVDRLKELGISPMLLTGDNSSAAASIAQNAGIETIHSDLLPEDKMRIIKEYSEKGEAVCMIGDGVNDALALTSADAGIAMGGIGSDIAIESADAVLAGDEIGRLPYLFDLTRKVMKKIRINIIASLVINLSAVLLSAFGVLTPVTGALWHNFGSVFVVVNAALLLRENAKDLSA